MITLPSPFRVALAAFAVFAAVGNAASAAQAQKAPRPEPTAFYAVYMQKAKIGSLVIKHADTRRNGKPATRTDTTMLMDLALMGAAVKTSVTSAAWSDPKTGKPLALESTTESAGRVTRVTATYTANAVTYSAMIQGTPQKGTLKLKPGEKFLFDTASSVDFTPRVGMTLKGKVFVPDMLRLMDSETSVVARETINVGGQSVVAYRVVEKNPVAPTTLWLNAAGDILRMDTMLGIQMLKTSKTIALAPPGANEAKIDLMNAVGITPTGEPLKNPRSLRTARYEISGVTRPLAVNNSVQTAEYQTLPPEAVTPETDKNERRALVTVTSRPLPASTRATLFKKPADAPANLRRFLQSTTYVPATDPAFVKIAQSVVGGETDAARAAAKIAAYVHKTIKPDPSIAALRTARDIRADPRGVCRDYTTFYTTIARAAGLPTKQCVGIAYANGKFLYHAWPEVWVGGDQWIALEPTWGAPFADATHIKLAEGEITDIFNIAADMGRYQVKVLSAE